MEFSYRINEAEYVRARKLPKKSWAQICSLIVRWNFLFWAALFVLVFILWTIVYLTARPAHAQPAQSHGHPAGLLTMFILCLFILAVFSIQTFLLFGIGPLRARRQYRKDPFLQSQFTVNVTQQSISIQSTAGASSQSAWNLYKYWREGENLIVLVQPSREFLTVNLAALSDLQRAELRSILASALPQK